MKQKSSVFHKFFRHFALSDILWCSLLCAVVYKLQITKKLSFSLWFATCLTNCCFKAETLYAQEKQMFMKWKLNLLFKMNKLFTENEP